MRPIGISFNHSCLGDYEIFFIDWRIHGCKLSELHSLRSRSPIRKARAGSDDTENFHPFNRKKTSVAKKATRLLPSINGGLISSDSNKDVAIATMSP